MRAALVVLSVAFAVLFASASAWAAGRGFSWDNSTSTSPSPPLTQQFNSTANSTLNTMLNNSAGLRTERWNQPAYQSPAVGNGTGPAPFTILTNGSRSSTPARTYGLPQIPTSLSGNSTVAAPTGTRPGSPAAQQTTAPFSIRDLPPPAFQQREPLIPNNTTVPPPASIPFRPPSTPCGPCTVQSPRTTVANGLFYEVPFVSGSVTQNPVTGAQSFGLTFTPGAAFRAGVHVGPGYIDVCPVGVGLRGGTGPYATGAVMGCVNVLNRNRVVRLTDGAGIGVGAEGASAGFGVVQTVRTEFGNSCGQAPMANTYTPTSSIRSFQPTQTGSWLQRPAPATPANLFAGNSTITTYHPSLQTSYSDFRSRTPQWGNASAGNTTITTYRPSFQTSYSDFRSRTSR